MGMSSEKDGSQSIEPSCPVIPGEISLVDEHSPGCVKNCIPEIVNIVFTTEK
jgi:hypothetical protein